MAGLMVYIPGSTGSDGTAELNRVGLGDLLDRNVAAVALPIGNSGPDGGSGRLIIFDMGPGFPDTPHNIDLQTQEWKPAPPDPEKRTECGFGRYWLGYVKAAKPGPRDLKRAELCDGEPVTLRDGNEWIVPIADYLPKRITIDQNTGAEVREVAERHRAFVHWADSLYEYFLSDAFEAIVGKEVVVQIPNCLSGVAMALAKNYRITREVIDLLELVEDYEVFEVAKTAIGMSGTLRALAEKKIWRGVPTNQVRIECQALCQECAGGGLSAVPL